MVHPHDNGPIADDGGADQALALRRPVAEFKLDDNIRAGGIEFLPRTPHPLAQARHAAEFPQHDSGRLAETRSVIGAASDQDHKKWKYYCFQVHNQANIYSERPAWQQGLVQCRQAGR